MNKKRLAILALAANSAQAQAFRFDTEGDFKIRWDNSFKFNAMSRVAKQDKDVYTVQGESSDRSNGWFIADDSDLSVDRGGAGLVSTRLDVLSEMDIVWKENFGLRVSGSAWYDPQYDDDNNDHPGDRRLSWASPSTPVGEYNHEAEDLHYAGGELLDAFVFANVDIGEDTSLGVRAGRHTIYWGQAALVNGAIHGIGGAMAPIDFTKALSVPGSEAKELFMPTGKISSVLQLSPNLTLNAYYSYEFQAYRMPEDGTYWSPVEGLTENSEFLTLIPGETVRSGFKMRGYSEDTGDYGFNLQYYVEPWGLDASFVYINYTDKNLHGLVGGLGPNLQASLLQPAAVFEDADSDNYPGAVGDTWHVNVSALHFLNGDWSLWDGGLALVEATFSMLDSCNENCQVLDTRINEDRVISQIAAVFKPTWYQVRPGWDLNFPMTVSYTIDGEKSPINFGGDEEGGAASIGAQVDINQMWLATVAYNNRFGPALAGTGGRLKDRDNISLTIKRTF